MRKTLVPFVLALLSINACTPDSILAFDPTHQIEQGKKSVKNNDSTPDIPDKIDEDLLNTGAEIHLIVTKQNLVTASFEFPKAKTTEIVTWWYKWEYIPVKGAGVKSSYDKTLKFNADSENYVLLYVQCTKSNGVKSNIILSGAKILFNTKTKIVGSTLKDKGIVNVK